MISPTTIALIKSINAAVKDAIITKSKDVEVIPSGSLIIDEALGVGGFPFGRISEIYGSESGGKSTISLSICANAQKMGITPTFIDTEFSVDFEYAQQIGVDIENLVLVQPDYAEDAYTCAEAAINGGSKLIIIDSIGAMVAKRETESESDIGDNQIGLMARINTKAIHRLVPMLKQNNVALIMINQMRAKIGAMPGTSTEDTPGGKALKHAYSIRMKITRTGKESGEDPNYITSKISVQKNKVAPPYGEGAIKVLFGYGIDLFSEVLDFGIEQKIIKKSGAWYKIGDEIIGQGNEAACLYIKAHPELYASIINGLKFKIDKKFYLENIRQ